MKGLILALLSIATVSCGPIAITAPVETVPPAAPLTAVVVTQCDHVVGVFFTFPDGRLVVIDRAHHDGVDMDKLKELVDSAGKSLVIGVTCGLST